MRALYCTVVQPARRRNTPGRTSFVRLAILATAGFVALSGCRRKDSSEELLRKYEQSAASAKARAVASVAEAMETKSPDVDAEETAPAGDLQGEVDQFTDLAGCVKKHRLTDPLLADGIEALGYERFVADACRSIEAMKVRDPKRCEEAISTPMRLHCVTDYAMLVGDEARCPVSARAADVPEHDVTCLAAARRDVRPCAVLAGMARATCEGLVAHDEARCGTDAHCQRLLARWKNALPRTLGRTPYAARATVDIKIPDGDVDGGSQIETHELSKEAAGGVVMILDGKITRIAFGDTRSFWVRSEVVEGGFVIDLDGTEPGDQKLTAIAGRAALRYPNTLVQEMSTMSGSVVHIGQIASEPNGPVKLTLETTVGQPGESRNVVFTVDSWLRDRVVLGTGKAMAHPLAAKRLDRWSMLTACTSSGHRRPRCRWRRTPCEKARPRVRDLWATSRPA